MSPSLAAQFANTQPPSHESVQAPSQGGKPVLSAQETVEKCVDRNRPWHECFNELHPNQSVNADFSGLYDSVFIDEPDITSVWVAPPSAL